MATTQTKEELILAADAGFRELTTLIDNTPLSVLEANFKAGKTSSKCTTFEQGNNMRDILMHIWEWQRLQSEFVKNIRKNEPKDFIPEPYRKCYKEMDRVNWERHQSITFIEALQMLRESHNETLQLIDGFTDGELFNKKVYKVTYTTTMGAYFVCVTTQPYGRAIKALKSHIRQQA